MHYIQVFNHHIFETLLSEKQIINICQELGKNISVKNVNI